MFTQSFENSERQRQRRQQRELALRRMQEAAGDISTSSYNYYGDNQQGGISSTRMTSAEYASNFLKSHNDMSGRCSSGGGDGSSISSGSGSNSNKMGGTARYYDDHDDNSEQVNLHNIKHSLHVNEANDYGEEEDEDSDYEDDCDDDSTMLQPTDQQQQRIHLDREGNMTNNSSITTKRTWRRPTRLVVCAVVATVAIIIIISVTVVVSVVGLGDRHNESVRGGVVDSNKYVNNSPSGFGNGGGGAAAVSQKPLSPQEQERFDAIRKTILKQHISTSQSLSDTSSPQYAAVMWLTRDDGLQMDVESNFLMQRYGLAVLWFSTTRSDYQWHMAQQELSSVDSEDLDEDDIAPDNEGQRSRTLTGNYDPDVWFRHDNWLSSSDICTWEGIACHTHKEDDGNQYDPNDNGHVASIELRRNNVQGLLPNELYITLPSLKVLDLSDNGIAGTISPKISAWTNLEYLNFTSNNLGGSLPSSIGNLSSLRDMHLAENQLANSIPHTIGSLSRLKHIDLSGNSIRGTIPYELGNLNELSTLDLSWNKLDGPLPHEVSRMQTLVTLDVCHNELVGPLLLELSDVQYLSVLRLDHNHFSGEVPTDMGALIHLEELRLNNNDFRGFLPSEISNLIGLGEQH